MQRKALKWSMIAWLTGGWLFQDVNCLPSRNQLNASFNGGITNGINLVLTLGITAIIQPLVNQLFPTTTTT
jgi:hypothetical protein